MKISSFTEGYKENINCSSLVLSPVTCAAFWIKYVEKHMFSSMCISIY